jgi:predicted ATPase/DNA-binding SARP family transcriptional activator
MRFGILGPVDVDRGDEPVGIPGDKQRALLALLVLHAGEVVPADRLVEALWGDALPANPRNALQSQVAQLRRRLAPGGEQLLVTRPAGYVLEVGDEAIDARRFERLLGDAKAARGSGDLGRAEHLLGEALALWRGVALPELEHVAGAAVEATRLRELWLTAQEERAETLLAAGRQAEAVTLLEGLVADHPLREGLRGLLMLALYRVGRQADALGVYHDARTVLQEELGIDPSPTLTRRYEELLRQDVELDGPDGAAVVGDTGQSAVDANPMLRDRLPAPLTALVGRDSDVERVLALVKASRLVTLVGPGGVGKTRLAIEAAHQARQTGVVPDGVWFVELASVEDAALLVETIADTLGLPTSSGLGAPPDARDAAARLTAALQGRTGLLVLDNCEHLVDAAAALARELLTGAPDLTVLATSREALGVTGESVWSLPSLGVPTAGARTLADVRDAGAVQLFVERAAQADATFQLEEATAPAVAEICRRLDGIPLALELAAARVRTLGVAEIADRLDDRFALLSSGDRTLQPRQRTLEAVVAWSWHLLDGPEQVLFRRLAVLVGPAELVAVEAVGADGEVVEAREVVALLDALVAKSLVVADPYGPSHRYRLLETLRSYADRQLDESGEQKPVRVRHTQYLTEVATAEVTRLRTPEQLQAMVRLDDHLDQFRACLRWLEQVGDHERGARLATELGWYWYLRGHRQDGIRWLAAFEAGAPRREAALSRLWQLFLEPDHQRLPIVDEIRSVLAAAVADLEEVGSAADRAFAGLLAANLSANLGDHEAFAPYLDAGRRAIAECRDEVYAATADFVAGQQLLLTGDVDGAQTGVQAALDRFERAGDRWGLVQCHIALAGMTELVGAIDQALDHVEAGLALAKQLRLRELEAILQTRRATLAVVAGDQVAASRAVAEAGRLADELGWVDLNRQVDLAAGLVALRDGRLDDADEIFRRVLGEQDNDASPMLASYALARLGTVAELRGDLDEADLCLGAALRYARVTGDPRSEALALEGLAGVRAAAGEGMEAALLLGAAAARREGVGLPLPDGEAVDVRRAETRARSSCGDDAVDAALAEGRTLAFSELPLPPDGQPGTSHPPVRLAAR